VTGSSSGKKKRRRKAESESRKAAGQPAPPITFRDPNYYLNRELSLLAFNRRVLAQATDPEVPLLERLRFLTICTTNLDEFFEIRVAGLKQQISYGTSQQTFDGRTAAETFQEVSELVHELVAEQYRTWEQQLVPALEREGIRVLRRADWTRKVARWVKRYFVHEVQPVITPIGLDPAHPFPQVLNKGLSYIVRLSGDDAYDRQSGVAVLQVPRSLPRVIPIPKVESGNANDFVLLGSVIHAHIGQLFPGMKVENCHQFRITRNSDLWVDEEEMENLLQALQGELPRRRFSDAVRVEVSEDLPEDLCELLLEQVNLGPEDLYRVPGAVNLHRLAAIYDHVRRADLKYKPFVPGLQQRLRGDESIFDVLKRGDVLLHHPFQSFAPVVELVRQAARDPNVLAIKQTLYRTDAGSPLVEALIEAAQSGTDVTALVELRARFDEQANIRIAHRLQAVGANVVYGIVGYKTHAKMLLIVRREGGKIRRYVHLGTGNYHAKTATAYTDVGLISASSAFGEDVQALFDQLTGLGRVTRMNRLLQSPFTLHKTLIKLIDAEIEEARAGRKARIIARMNSLSELTTIRKLYEASQAGVRIDLLVRGICCLRPGIPGVSENIRVRSIVGRFLEHSRVYYFYGAGEEHTYCSSADWMSRNLFRRVETCFPVRDARLRQRLVHETLEVYLQDNRQAWELGPDGSYTRVHPAEGEEPVSAQELLLERHTS